MGERPDRPDEVRRDPLDRQDPRDAREPIDQEREIGERARGGDEVARTRAEIERTRADMSETVDALQERLSPQNLKEQAKVQAKDTARGAGSGFVERIKQNPVPAAMVGIGLGWLLMSGREQDRERRYPDGPYYDRPPAYAGPPAYYGEPGIEAEGRRTGQGESRSGQVAGQAQDRARQVTGQAQERASQLGGQAQEQAQRARGGFQQMLQENPLAVGALAVGLGAAVGFSLPGTSKEDEVMGETRDSLVEQGKEKAQDVKERAQRAAEEGQRAAKEEAQNQGLGSE